MDKKYASREDIKIIQGIAVMLMVFHHLFGFPDRVSVSYYAPLDFGLIHLETIIAYFGRICVAIFSFCSGYGLYQKNMTIAQSGKWTLFGGYKEILQSIKKFYFRYWIVFIVFIPYGFYNNIYNFIPLQFVKNIFGIAYTYNKEWWYVFTYLRLLVIFPLLFIFIRRTIGKGNRKSFFTKSIAVICLLSLLLYLNNDTEAGILTYLITFYIGMLVAESDILKKFLGVKTN